MNNNNPNGRKRPRSAAERMSDEEFARYQAWLAEKRAREQAAAAESPPEPPRQASPRTDRPRQNPPRQNAPQQNPPQQNPRRQGTAQDPGARQQNQNPGPSPNRRPTSGTQQNRRPRPQNSEIPRTQNAPPGTRTNPSAPRNEAERRAMEQRRQINARRRAEAQARNRARRDYERRIRDEENRIRRTERKAALRRIIRIVLAVLAAAAVLALLVAGGIHLALHRTPDAPIDSGTIAFYYGGTKVRSAPAADCIDGDEIYVCFNDLSAYLGMKESGSAEEMKFILPTKETPPPTAAGDGTEESVTFFTGEHRIVVNGQTELLEVPNKLIGENIWVSSEFLTDWMNNLSFSYRSNRREVKVSRILDEEQSDPSNRINVYFPVSFRLKKNEPLEAVAEDANVGFLTDSLREATTFELNFQTDLEAYEGYMNPTGELRDAFLVLVNPENPLSAADVPSDLTDVKYTSTSRNTQQLREYPTRALEALFQEMHHYGYYNMAVYSGYRSYDYQATIYEQYVQNEMASNPSLTREEAEAIVLTYATRPGTSEHQTGLAVDMDTLGSFTVEFAWTTEYYWLQENAWKFGFILRFPQDKEEITSITFEPWHYRYVGRYHAKIIHDNGLCLEEYIARLGK